MVATIDLHRDPDLEAILARHSLAWERRAIALDDIDWAATLAGQVRSELVDEGALRNGAREAASMAGWVRAGTGITIPRRRITPSQYRAGRPGFIGHGELDPTRRSDPGPAFPWTEFLDLYATEMQGAPMPTDESVREIQTILTNAGFKLGPIDGIIGPRTVAAMHAYTRDLVERAAKHLVAIAKTYWKCDLRSTRSAATDVRKKWPACNRFRIDQET